MKIKHSSAYSACSSLILLIIYNKFCNAHFGLLQLCRSPFLIYFTNFLLRVHIASI